MEAQKAARPASVKIMIDTHNLVGLLAANPTAELEIMRVATEKVAEMFRQKVDRKAANIDQLIDEAVRETFGGRGLKPEVTRLIRDYVKLILDETAIAGVQELVRKTVKEEASLRIAEIETNVKRFADVYAQQALNSVIAAADKHILDLLKGISGAAAATELRIVVPSEPQGE